MTENQTLHPWYSEETGFFGPYYLVTYQDMLTEEATAKEVSFLEQTLKLTKGAAILDLCCGHGRHSVELARRGYRVTGQDLNSFFLRNAATSAEQAKVMINWVHSDMRHIAFTHTFDAVINMFTAFGYLENDAEDQRVLYAVSNALRTGGKFLLDVINHEWLVRNFKRLSWQKLQDGSVTLMERTFDFVSGRIEEQITWLQQNGEKREFATPLRVYTLKELVTMGETAGLTFEEVHGGFSGEPYGLDAKRCIVLMQKKNNKDGKKFIDELNE